ncbi:MAG: TM2 domain-containing protein [Bacteroidales bacterium]|nr:TM2 domain-containing protein [Bacteroidales bacterium]
MTNLYQILPELDMQEMNYIQSIVRNFNENQLVNFANMYRVRRRDPQIVLLTALIGFLGIAGVHRFMLNQIGMGILYVFTGGLCFIGTIIDLINHRQLAMDYNIQVANELSLWISKMPS